MLAPLPSFEVAWHPLPMPPLPLPSLLAGVSRIFVGREQQTEGLLELWKEAATGERRVALVEVHELRAPAPEEGWLRPNARLVDARELRDARLFFFDLDAGRAGSSRMAKRPDAELERAPLLPVTTGRAILSR